jgi:uncharacterized membrane protein YqjE
MHLHSEKSAGVIGSLRRLSATAIELLLLRLTLFGNEIELEKSRIIRGLVSALIATAAFSMGILFLCLVLIVMAGTDYQFTIICVLSVLFLSVGVFFILKSSKLMTSANAIFVASTSELQSDLQHLRGHNSDG